MNPIEAVATALGVANQWLAVRQNVWCWPVGIASVALFAFVFAEAKLYSDAGLQVVYVVLQAIGWVRWRSAGVSHGTSLRPVAVLSGAARVAWLAVAAVSALVLGTTMATLTDAASPFADATATCASLVAQWLQTRKVIESWLLFLAANAVFIVLYVSKGLYLTTALFVLLSAMAAWGFAAWRRALRAQRAAEIVI